jgi:hypothetical protein
MYVTFEESKKMRQALRYMEQNATNKDIIKKCKDLTHELKGARPDVDYSPFRGYQVPIKDSDEHFMVEVWKLVDQSLQLDGGKS